MAEIANYSVRNEMGCGFMAGIFQKLYHNKPKKSHVHSLTSSTTKTEPLVVRTAQKLDKPLVDGPPDREPSIIPDQNPSRVDTPRTSSNSFRKSNARISTSSSSNHDSGEERNPRRDSVELGILGNLKRPCPAGGGRAAGSASASNSPASASRAMSAASMGNIMRRNSCSGDEPFRGVSSKSVDPEGLKRMGNEAYKNGRFREALMFYDKAIALDSDKAAYRSNRSAALIGLGRLVEAVSECEEAIRIEPCYERAHHRLASLYLRLGEAEKATYHYKHSGCYASSKDVEKAQALQKCLVNCSEAQKLQNWNAVMTETQVAISSGATSSPMVCALQGEALLKLLRHEEAYKAYQKGPSLSIDVWTKFFGISYCAHYLIIGSYVYLSCGRFEDSVEAAQQAAKLDPSNEEASKAVKRARAVSSARSNGNLLFKAEKFSQACIVYSHGLEHDPNNSVLLCNRAACRSKLGQFEKAVEDCTAALCVNPSYGKARLRRADCNAKLERWESSIQDYEVLIRETPGDEEVGRALFESQIQLKRHRGEDIDEDIKFGSNLVFISSNERFRHIVTSPGMSVVLFCNKGKQKRVLQALEQVCKRFPSVNFLKVEVEDHPYLVKMEGVNNVPTFKIYKNGSGVKEIPGSNHELLESSVKRYST